MTTRFSLDSNSLVPQVCVDPVNFPDGDIPRVITIIYSRGGSYDYRYIKMDEAGNHCYGLIPVAGKRRRKKETSTVCPTICMTGLGQLIISPPPRTIPCSAQRQPLTDGAVGAQYFNQLIATPAGTYTFAVTAGSTPPGVTVNSDGSITGVPTQDDTFDFTVTATDSNGCTGSQDFSILVTAA